MIKKKGLVLTTFMLGAALLGGCGDKKNSNTEAESLAVELTASVKMMSAEDISLVYKEGFVISELTGEWIDESLEHQRPLTIMINNLDAAMPQSGISQADITYEMLVEGGITRLMCVFKDYSNIPKLGPVRSSRHYYVQVSNMYEGIYAHVGWSPFAQTEIESTGTNNLNGLTNLSNTMYYRDNQRVAPHNCYTDSEGINTGIAEMGYQVEYSSEPNEMFKFNIEDTDLGNGNAANKVTTAYSSSRMPWFEYDSATKLYNRFQYGEAHIDDQTNEQLTYKNVIVMNVEYYSMGTAEGHLGVNWDNGTGYYFTNGEYEAITWDNNSGYIKYYSEDGNQLKMNPGKTFITVFDEAVTDGIIIE